MLRISAKHRNMAARLRPAQVGAGHACKYGARLRLSPRTSALTVSTARVAPASQNTPTSLTKPHWSETSSSGCTRNCRARPCTLASQFSRSALPPKTQSDWLRALASAPGNESSRPGDKAIGYAAGWHERPARLTVLVPARLWPRLANRQLRQHTLCVRSLVPRSLLYSDRADTPHS